MVPLVGLHLMFPTRSSFTQYEDKDLASTLFP